MGFVACGLGFAMAAAVADYVIETKRLDATVHAMALHEAGHLIESRNRATGTASTPVVDMNGFVFARVTATPTVEPSVADLANLPPVLRSRLRGLLATGGAGMEHVNFKQNGQRFVFLSFALDKSGRRFSGLYRVGALLSRSLDRSVMWAALGIFLAVAAATASLIPVLATLERLVLAFARDASDANIDTLLTLGNAIAQRDSDTDAHNYRVTLYALRLGETLGLAEAETRSLLLGAFLHDIGKIGISDSILLKPGALSADEIRSMQTHVRRGLEIVGASRWLHQAQDVIGAHHERYDGSGYPEGRAGTNIPRVARIFAIVDVFDALTSRRPYKAPLSLRRAGEILAEGRGTQFDPEMLDCFLRIAPGLLAEWGGAAMEQARSLLAAAFEKHLSAIV